MHIERNIVVFCYLIAQLHTAYTRAVLGKISKHSAMVYKTNNLHITVLLGEKVKFDASEDFSSCINVSYVQFFSICNK